MVRYGNTAVVTLGTFMLLDLYDYDGVLGGAYIPVTIFSSFYSISAIFIVSLVFV